MVMFGAAQNRNESIKKLSMRKARLNGDGQKDAQEFRPSGNLWMTAAGERAAPLDAAVV